MRLREEDGSTRISQSPTLSSAMDPLWAHYAILSINDCPEASSDTLKPIKALSERVSSRWKSCGFVGERPQILGLRFPVFGPIGLSSFGAASQAESAKREGSAGGG